MAELAFSRASSPAPSSAADVETSLRPLKNRLLERFPAVKSAHLTEALAAGLGFNSNAALRASTRPMSDMLALASFEPERFHKRLIDFEYEVLPDFQVGSPSESLTPPAHYLEWLRELQELEKTPDRVWPRIYALRRACADEFAKTFELGHRENREDKSVALRLGPGIDHDGCLPNWGAKVNAPHDSFIDFPGTDHRWRFCQALPLANGKVVEYESAMASMPYVANSELPREHEAAARLAGRLGWTCSIHTEWSWYAVGNTALVLFKRTTPHAKMKRAWDNSFKRWTVENRSRLMKSASTTRRRVIEDIVSCQHLPLDVSNFDDCRERYFKEFALSMYYAEDPGILLVFKRLMEKWADESGVSR
jgi:hypothetical protein